MNQKYIKVNPDYTTSIEVVYNALQDLTIAEEMSFIYDNYVLADDSQLTEGAIMLKNAYKLVIEDMELAGVIKVNKRRILNNG